MARNSSSSPSSSSENGKKEKNNKKKKTKDKKEKKEHKDSKDKKDKKDKKASKEAQAKSRAAAWECDRAEALRLVKSLLVLDAEVAEELGAVFEGLDSGALVRLECVADKQARKKLRHLLQALRLEPAEGGFRSPCRKVAFKALFESLLGEARGAAAGALAPAPQAAAESARKRAKARYAPEPAQAAPAEVAAEAAEAPEAAEAATPVAAPKPPRRLGPQLPGASVGPAVGGDDSESESVGEAGPKGEGEEREGLDLDMIIEEECKREAWMTMCPDGMQGTLGDGPGSQRDKYEVRRSTAEQKEFEEMFRARGPSLLQAQKNGDFAGFEEERRAAAQKRVGPSDAELWGASEKDQQRGGAQKRQLSAAPRSTFDPERDMKDQSKPMTADAFSKLVENSQSTLSGKFVRGAMATSFL